MSTVGPGVVASDANPLRVAGVAADANPPPSVAVAARELFGDALPVAIEYARLLMTDGVVRGLIGPREASRIWERHLLNCAAAAELVPMNAYVVDIGSGAGLPGIVLAVARPDLRVTLVEPLARRATFLVEATTKLGLADRVSVVRARAEEIGAGRPRLDPADVVTARAVARLDRLASWCLPLAAVGGRLLALKGASADDEVAAHQAAVARLGGGTPVVRLCGVDVIDPPTTVVEIVRVRASRPPARRSTPDGVRDRRGRGRQRRS